MAPPPWTPIPVEPATFSSMFSDNDTIKHKVMITHADRIFDEIVLQHKFTFAALASALPGLTVLDSNKKYVLEVPPGLYNGGLVLAVMNGNLQHVLCGNSDKFVTEDISRLTPSTLHTVAFDEAVEPVHLGIQHCKPASIHRTLWRVLSNVIVPYLEALQHIQTTEDRYTELEEFFTPDVVSQIVTAAQEEIKSLTSIPTLCPLPGAKPTVRVLGQMNDADETCHYRSSLPIYSFHITLTGTLDTSTIRIICFTSYRVFMLGNVPMPTATKCDFGNAPSISAVLMIEDTNKVPAAKVLAQYFHAEAKRLLQIENTVGNPASVLPRVAPRLTCYAIQKDAYAIRNDQRCLKADRQPCIYTRSTEHVELVFDFVTDKIRAAIAAVPDFMGIGRGIDRGWSAFEIMHITEPQAAHVIWNAVQVSRMISEFDDTNKEQEDQEPYSSEENKKNFCDHLLKLNIPEAEIAQSAAELTEEVQLTYTYTHCSVQ